MKSPTDATTADPPLPPENTRQTRKEDLERGPFKIAKILVNSFSGTGKRRPGQARVADVADEAADEKTATVTASSRPAKKTRHLRLITIAVSHFCEKARWALDLLEADPESPVYYTEDAHPPAFAAFATVPASDGAASVTPMVLFDGEVLYDSGRIVRRLCPFLYPPSRAGEIESFEDYLGRNLGATARCYAYHQLLDDRYRSELVKVATAHTSRVEAFLFEKMLPNGLARDMRKTMKIDDESADTSLCAIREVFRRVSSNLEDSGGEYIFDSREERLGFTAADLAFAALASPLIRPPELSSFQVEERRLPPKLAELRVELLDTPAGKHALRMYKNHRFGMKNHPQMVHRGKMTVIPKSVGRNKIPWVGILCAAGVVSAAVAGSLRLRESSRL